MLPQPLTLPDPSRPAVYCDVRRIVGLQALIGNVPRLPSPAIAF